MVDPMDICPRSMIGFRGWILRVVIFWDLHSLCAGPCLRRGFRVLTGTQERGQAFLEVDALLNHLFRHKKLACACGQEDHSSFCYF